MDLRQKDFSRFLAISAQRKMAKIGTPKPLFWQSATSPHISGTERRDGISRYAHKMKGARFGKRSLLFNPDYS
jgi:hypothetical protein